MLKNTGSCSCITIIRHWFSRPTLRSTSTIKHRSFTTLSYLSLYDTGVWNYWTNNKYQQYVVCGKFHLRTPFILVFDIIRSQGHAMLFAVTSHSKSHVNSSHVPQQFVNNNLPQHLGLDSKPSLASCNSVAISPLVITNVVKQFSKLLPHVGQSAPHCTSQIPSRSQSRSNQSIVASLVDLYFLFLSLYLILIPPSATFTNSTPFHSPSHKLDFGFINMALILVVGDWIPQYNLPREQYVEIIELGK